MNASRPGFMFITGHCPNCAGGQGLGWRVGARMVNMEFPYTHAGPKYLQRCGKATWIGVYRYPDGKPIGPFATKSDPQYGDVPSDIWNSVFEDVMRKGTGPAYMDCSDATDEQMAYMRWAMTGEGLTALLTYMEKEGIDPQKHGVEFLRYEPILHGRGLDVSDEGETSVPGLFAAGDLVGNGGCGIALAAYLGWEGGMAAAAQAEPAPVGNSPYTVQKLAPEEIPMSTDASQSQGGADAPASVNNPRSAAAAATAAANAISRTKQARARTRFFDLWAVVAAILLLAAIV